MSTHEDLRTIALAEFATAGYSATSLQRIAELAGLSKSSVLYHFASKEALLEAGVGPAIDSMDEIITTMERTLPTPGRRREFIVEFVDFLLGHRDEVHIFVTQARSLEDVPVVERANQVVVRMASIFTAAVNSREDQLRFGIALGGAAYCLANTRSFALEPTPVDETRAALITIMSDLLTPISVSTVGSAVN